MISQPDLTITIVSWNTQELLRGCLRSIQQSNTRASLEIHVVDNASTDGSAEVVRTEFPSVKLIVNQENLGFAAANNQSWAQAQARYWLLLNSDAEVKPGALDTLVTFMDVHAQAGLATAKLLNPDASPQYCAQPVPSIWRLLLETSRVHKLLPAYGRGRVLLSTYWNYRETIPVGWTWGTALIARREAVEEAGSLSEDFFMYGEDLEWCLRMRRHGWKVWFCHNAEVLHYGGQSSAKKWEDARKQKIILDNSYKAIEMHRGRLYVALLKTAMLFALKIDQIIKRLTGRGGRDSELSISYHKAALKLGLANLGQKWSR
jgi:GT2 family glycosyltransferase